ncbi:MAG: hypothetical protein AB7O52_07005 [Planctomycetota bacterium]
MLGFERLEALSVVGFEAAVLIAPAMDGGSRNTDVLGGALERHRLEQFLELVELCKNLRGLASSSFLHWFLAIELGLRGCVFWRVSVKTPHSHDLREKVDHRSDAGFARFVRFELS